MPTRSLLPCRIELIGFCLLAAFAGYPPCGHGQTAPPVRTSPIASPRRAPCWQQVGIAKTAVEQRRAIERSTREEVQAVCADSSLTAQQKHKKIKEIRLRARQQIDAIITPQQQEELKACNAERGGSRPLPPRWPVGGRRGPCGESASAAPAPEGEPPAEAPKQP